MVMEGRYMYCITDLQESSPALNFGNIGIGESPVFSIGYKDIGAVISSIPFKQMASNMNDIESHQRVVEAARSVCTVLPVRFGVILKNEEGIKKLLANSYKDYSSKIARLRGKEEIGIKILLGKTHMKKIQVMVEKSDSIVKLKKEISLSKPGASHFLKLKLQDAIKTEMHHKIDQMVNEINNSLMASANDKVLLKNDIDEIVFNAAYLVEKQRISDFDAKVQELKRKYDGEGMTLHKSGPWAPYSFC